MYEDKQICTAIETKFLGLFINNTLSQKIHIGYIKSKLSSTCYAMQSFKPYVSLNNLKMIYYSYFHSVMTYGFLFCGHSSDCIKIFRSQKKIKRIMMDFRNSDSCRQFFFNLEILPLASQYFLSLLLFMIKKTVINLCSILRYITLTLSNNVIFTNSL